MGMLVTLNGLEGWNGIRILRCTIAVKYIKRLLALSAKNIGSPLYVSVLAPQYMHLRTETCSPIAEVNIFHCILYLYSTKV